MTGMSYDAPRHNTLLLSFYFSLYLLRRGKRLRGRTDTDRKNAE